MAEPVTIAPPAEVEIVDGEVVPTVEPITTPQALVDWLGGVLAAMPAHMRPMFGPKVAHELLAAMNAEGAWPPAPAVNPDDPGDELRRRRDTRAARAANPAPPTDASSGG